MDQFGVVAEQSPNMIFVNQRGRLVYVNPRCCELMGYTREEFQAEDFDFRQTIAAASLDRAMHNFALHLEGREVSPYEIEVVTKRGDPITVIIATRLIAFCDEPAILAIMTDITDRKRAQRELQQSEARYRTLVETCPDGITVTDTHGKLLMTNQQAAQIHGFESAEAMLAAANNALDLIAPHDHDRAKEGLRLTLANGAVRNRHYDLLRGDGSTVQAELSASVIRGSDGSPTGFIGVIRDISERIHAESERRRLQAQLQQAQKLDSLGVLAGGIAHDFNNLLTGILGAANLARRGGSAESIQQLLEGIEHAATRAADLTRQLLDYSGRGVFQTQPVQVGAVLEEIGALVHASIPKTVSVTYDLDDQIPLIDANPGQIHQVAMNLLLNAAEAMGSAGGEVQVETGQFHADREYLASCYTDDDLAAGDYCYLEVVDTGCGMDPDAKARMFDPFFTTKFTGRGLGLAAVLGIIRAHRGAIRVDSTPGQGTRVRALFPAAPGLAGSSSQPSLEQWQTDGGTVLVVDDEATVRAVAKDMLEALGFDVLTADGGRAGIDQFRRCAGRLQLVLVDLTMPDIGGEQLAREFASIRAEVPVILSSGYTKRALPRRPSDNVVGFLQKPYTLKALRQRVAEALAR